MLQGYANEPDFILSNNEEISNCLMVQNMSSTCEFQVHHISIPTIWPRCTEKNSSQWQSIWKNYCPMALGVRLPY